MSAETSPRLASVGASSHVLSFGPFELDVETAELRRDGVRVKLQLQPARVLSLLASQPGQLTTREQIQREVWPDGTFVDFEQSLNFCIRQIRGTLGDEAAAPRYIETLPRRGYRFIAPVRAVGKQGQRSSAQAGVAMSATGARQGRQAEPRAVAIARPAQGRLAAALGGLTLVCLVSAGYLALQRSAGPTTPVFERLTFRRGSLDSARFAPDGQVVYGAAWEGGLRRLYTTRPASRDSRPIGVPSGTIVGISAQGEIAFVSGMGASRALSRAPLAGGPVKAVLERVIWADWTPDGSSFAITRRTEEGESRIEFPVGRALGHAHNPSHLRISPNGDRLAYLEHPIVGDDRGSVVVIDLEGRKKVLSEDWASAEGLAWAPNGREVWFTAARVGADSALHAVTLEGRLRTLVPALGRLVIHDVAPDGRALVERNTLRQEIRFGGPSQPMERDLSWFDLSSVVAISADGRRVLFVESGEGGGPGYSVFLRDTDGTVPVRIGHGRATALSPDGQRVLSIPLEDSSRLQVLPTGAGEILTVEEPGIERFLWAGWLPDGMTIVFTATGEQTAPRVYLKQLPDGNARPITPEGVGLFRNTIAPDGKTFVARCGGTACLYPIPGGEPRELPAQVPPYEVLGWDEAAGSLFVAASRQIPVRVDRVNVASGSREPWREIAPLDRAGVEGLMNIVITPDGACYAYGFGRRLSDLYLVEGLQ